jgi:surfactin synthase thioesterase subunit/MFS family permease
VLVAYWVAARSTAIPTSQALRDHAHSQLPLYMAPSAYIRLDSMPLTVNGKLDSRALPKPDTGTEHDERTPARHELDERIITIWQDTLGVECIGIDDDFFHLGGDSLTVMRVIRHIDPRLRVVTLFQNPTIRQLSDAITNSDDRDNGLLCRISPPTSSPPAATIVAVPYGGGSAASYRELATALPDEYPLYAVDIPGHDFADATQPLEPFDTVVQRVVAEIRDKIDGPVLVYGHCVGSAMATAITYGTHEHGAEVLGAALGGAYPSPYLPGRLAQRWAQLFPSDRWKSDRAYRERLSMVGGFSDAIDPAEQEFIVRALRHDSRGADAYFSEHCDGRSQQRRLPALCVVGEYDRLTEFHTERHHEWNMLYTHTDLAVVPHAGHYFLKHQPDQLAATLVGWINRRRDALAAPADTLSGNVSQPTSYDTPLPAPPTADSGTVVIRSSLRDFLLVCVGQLLTMTGTRISAFGLGVWTYTLTGQATLFSLTLACAVLPGLLVLPFAGAAVDRWDRRGVMIVGDVIGGAGIALCLAMYALGGLAPWHTYLAAAAGSIATNFQQPAFLAATAQLVPKQYLARINGLLQGLIATSQAAGPLLGAALVFATGVGWMLTIDVITTLVSITFLLVVAFPDTLFRKREESMWKEISGGFRYIARRPGLVAINGYFLVYNLFLGFAIALIPLMILSFGSAGTLSLAGALEGIGGIIGGLAMGLWGGFARRATGMIGFGILTGIGMIIAGLYPAPVFPILGVTAVGASIALLNGHWRTLIQNKVGMELQGRIITTNRMVANLSEPVGVLCAGWLADMWFEPAVHSGGWLGHTIRSIFGQSGEHGIALMLMVFGVAEALLAIIGLRWRVLRYIEDVLPDAVLGATVTWDRDQLQAEADRLLRQAEQDFDRVTQSPDHSSHLRTFSIRPQHTMGQTGRDGL